MGSTVKAVEVSTPDVLRVVERPKPAAGQGRLRVEACGVCHSDLTTVQGDYPGLKLPRVPGHERRIEEIGPNVSKWKIGYPTLIVQGNKDIVVTPINAFTLAEHLANAQLIMYPDSSHGAYSQYAENFLENARLFLGG
jgi:D-arabinose 1-dehydrogenase-like Zn-dependent alcohol dehydrogenase